MHLCDFDLRCWVSEGEGSSVLVDRRAVMLHRRVRCGSGFPLLLLLLLLVSYGVLCRYLVVKGTLLSFIGKFVWPLPLPWRRIEVIVRGVLSAPGMLGSEHGVRGNTTT